MLLALYAYLAFAALVLLFLVAADINGIARNRDDSWELERGYRPKTLVIVPCRGEEPFLYENLVAAKSQSYRNYDLIAVVDRDDVSFATVRRAKVAWMAPARGYTRCSDKVGRVASAVAAKRRYDAYVILDSDERVGEGWLGRLVAPLADKRVGVSVMFPLFKPIDNGFWSRVKQVWGFVGQSLLESRKTRFAAGGSMAFRKELLDSASFRFFTTSKYSVADDICLNLIAKRKGLEIAYTAHYHPVTYVKESRASLFEWANRQTALSIFGYRRILYYGIAYYSAEILVLATGIVGAVLISPIMLVFLAHLAGSIAKNVSRSGGAGAWIAPVTLLMPFLYLSNLIAASRMRSIRWRGKSYSLR
ncbi:MAG: glycosyltransferase [Candidatus Micrarchaeota archaeon]|nr:glycosyltransferase [Candidatus Micrarchaeota archaeon]